MRHQLKDFLPLKYVFLLYIFICTAYILLILLYIKPFLCYIIYFKADERRKGRKSHLLSSECVFFTKTGCCSEILIGSVFCSDILLKRRLTAECMISIRPKCHLNAWYGCCTLTHFRQSWLQCVMNHKDSTTEPLTQAANSDSARCSSFQKTSTLYKNI